MNTTHEYRRGEIVVFTSDKMHQMYPQFYPRRGTRGVIFSTTRFDAEIRWEKGTTSRDDIWWARYEHIKPAHSPR